MPKMQRSVMQLSDFITITETVIKSNPLRDLEVLPDKRSVRVRYDTVPHPQPRQNRNSRWGTSTTAVASMKYNNWRGAFRDALFLSMAKNKVEQFGEVPLKLTVKFTVKGRHGDLSNYIKALEDVLNGILWADDKWVHQINDRRRVRVHIAKRRH